MLRNGCSVPWTAGEMNLNLIGFVKYFFTKGFDLIVSAFIDPCLGIYDKPYLANCFVIDRIAPDL